MKLPRTLAVTSPHMKGKDVEHAQKMLNSTAAGTKFGNFHPGGVDGNYGPDSGQAAREQILAWLSEKH